MNYSTITKLCIILPIGILIAGGYSFLKLTAGGGSFGEIVPILGATAVVIVAFIALSAKRQNMINQREEMYRDHDY